MTTPCLQLVAPFEVRFADLMHKGRELVFPCDARGCVDLDTLSERAREDYFFARAMVGRGFLPPRVAPTGCARDKSVEGDAVGR
jgi:hypothetical protein